MKSDIVVVGGGASGLMAAGGIFLLFWRRFHAQTRQENAVCQVTLAREGASVKVAALIDSGNALVEPKHLGSAYVMDLSSSPEESFLPTYHFKMHFSR